MALDNQLAARTARSLGILLALIGLLWLLLHLLDIDDRVEQQWRSLTTSETDEQGSL